MRNGILQRRCPPLPAERQRRPSSEGFTLIELLVVIAVIGLLVGILLPALAAASQGAKISVCKSHLSQLGLVTIVYADQHQGYIPRGPSCTGPFDFVCADVATNQLWIGAGNEGHPKQPIGLGTLLEQYVSDRRICFCPADDSGDLEEELPRFGSDLDAYGSYTYRQLDQLPQRARGLISRLGVNVVGGVNVSVEALAFDTNSLGPGVFRRTNHGAKKANVLYRDRSVHTFSNRQGTFTIPRETFASPMNIFVRLDQLLVNADYGYRHDPVNAPRFDPLP